MLLFIMNKIKVLFVCMGNICRSPTAEGVFTQLVHKRNLTHLFEIDSAGTHDYHIGKAPDARSQKAAKERGIELSHLRARQVEPEDFENFDYVLAMDKDNYSILIHSCPEPYQDKIKFFLEYAPHLGIREVPDPYFGGAHGFERVLDMVEEASQGFLTALQKAGKIKSTA